MENAHGRRREFQHSLGKILNTQSNTQSQWHTHKDRETGQAYEHTPDKDEREEISEPANERLLVLQKVRRTRPRRRHGVSIRVIATLS